MRRPFPVWWQGCSAFAKTKTVTTARCPHAVLGTLSLLPRVFYNRRMRTVSVCGLLYVLIFAAAVRAQNAPAVKSNDTSYVTCGDKAAMSRTVSSDIFVSPDGKRRAYARVTANSVGGQINPERSFRMCVNNSMLFVSSDESSFDLVFLQEATDLETGNSLQIIDWSADSRRLLLELAQWQYESPGVTRSPLIYQAELGVFQQPDLSRSFRKEFGIDCSMDVHVAGYSALGKIIIETEPMTPEEEEVLAIPSCSRKKGEWVLNVSAESITPLSESAKIVRNAKIEPAPK